MEEKKCFAYVNKRKCSALLYKNCLNCNFFKTTEQYIADLLKLQKHSFNKTK